MTTLKVRQGFTLVELLVVIAIIGVLVGLLVPAVQAAREASRAMSCRNNLHQLKTAIAVRETSLGVLPGYVNTVGVKGTDLQVRASWVVTLLPHLEQTAVWDRWAQGRVGFDNGQLEPAARPYLDFLVCPSDPPVNTRMPSLSYVGSAGCLRRSQGSCVAGFTPNQRSPYQQVGENPANGLFFDRSRSIVGPNDQTGPTDFNGDANRPLITITTAYVQAKGDGSTATLMLAENSRAVHWAFLDPVEYADGPIGDSGATTDEKFHFGFLWEQPDIVGAAIASGVWPDREMRINGGERGVRDDLDRIKDLEPIDGFPSSNHPGGVNVAFLGGSVRFLSDQIDLLTYAQLMTSNRQQTDLQQGGVFEDELPPPSDNAF